MIFGSHCEERSDEAISLSVRSIDRDCFAEFILSAAEGLAMAAPHLQCDSVLMHAEPADVAAVHVHQGLPLLFAHHA